MHLNSGAQTWHQFLKAMKLTALLLTLICLQVSARSYAQINLSRKNAPLPEVLQAIQQQTGYTFFYKAKLLENINVTVNLRNASIQEALERSLADQALTYEIVDKTVAIKAKPASLLDRIIAAVTAASAHGKVTDENGDPLPGATVTVKGTNIATLTDNQGEFTLNGIPEQAELTITSIGYKPLTLRSAAEIGTIKLEVAVSPLDQVQIMGYGTTSKRLNTGSVSSVKAEDIEKQPVTNVLSALSGRIPGVFVQTTNGLPGGNINVQIRGKGSIQAGTDPLYVVDGVPFSSAVVPAYNAIAAGSITGAVSPLNSLNPADIESITVLKDADATAIYGSRGTNGVILIVTKKGISGKTNVAVNFSQGISRIANYPKLLNRQQYLQLRREAFKNDGTKPTLVNAPDLLVYDTTKNTDWPKYYFGNTGHLTDVQTNLSGGSDNTRFNISGNYHGESTVLPGNNLYQRGGLHTTLQHNSSDKRFSILFSGSYNVDKNRSANPAGDPSFGLILPPDYAIYDASGNYNWIMSNPAAEMQSTNLIKTDNLVGNLVVNYHIMEGLDFKISTGYNKINVNQTVVFPTDALYPGTTNYTDFDQNSNQSIIIEPQVNYKKIFKRSTLSILAGASYQNKISQEQAIEASNFATKALMQNIGSAQSLSSSNTYTQYKYESLFGRITYNWQDVYILNATLRRDGSSRFGADNRFGNFGSIGGAWLITNENWFKNSLPFLSYGKLRASYGLTGNDQIPDYQYLSTYASNGYLNYQGFSALYPARIANYNFHWETTRKLEFAAELGVLADRILMSVAHYQNRSNDQLVAYAIPYLTGFNSFQANLPAVVENTGWEFELNTQNIKKPQFKWSTTFNITLPRNVLKSFQNFNESSYAQILQLGYDITRYYGYTFLGVDPATGKASYASQAGSGSSSPYLYNTLGKQTPDFYGGVGNSINYKRWQLDLFGQFAKQMGKGGIYNSPGTKYNNYAIMLGRWMKAGDQTDIPKASNKNDALYASSSANFFNTSYFRLKNVNLSYSFPPEILKKFKVSQLRLYAEGQNIFTLWDHNSAVLDPESGALTFTAKNIPPMRSIVAGIQVSL